MTYDAYPNKKKEKEESYNLISFCSIAAHGGGKAISGGAYDYNIRESSERNTFTEKEQRTRVTIVTNTGSGVTLRKRRTEGKYRALAHC